MGREGRTIRMKSSSELKRRARQALVGNYGAMIGAGILVFAVSSGLNLLLSLFTNGSLLYQISFLIVGFLTAILAAGISLLTLNIARGRKVRAADVFAVFSLQPDRLLILTLLLELICAACVLPAAVSLALGFFFFPWLSGSSLALLVLAGCIVSILLLVAVSLRYALVYFLCFDYPELSAVELMRESARRMRGRKGQYFYLQISFLGMYLLGALSFGIGYLWILPYVSMTDTCFYLET